MHDAARPKNEAVRGEIHQAKPAVVVRRGNSLDDLLRRAHCVQYEVMSVRTG